MYNGSAHLPSNSRRHLARSWKSINRFNKQLPSVITSLPLPAYLCIDGMECHRRCVRFQVFVFTELLHECSRSRALVTLSSKISEFSSTPGEPCVEVLIGQANCLNLSEARLDSITCSTICFGRLQRLNGDV
jgi:hypothetical protein